MKFICISDTHGLHNKITVPDGDVLIHSGDFCNRGGFDELIAFNAWLGTLPHKHKIVVPGNHDMCIQQSPSHSRVLLGNAVVLVDEEITIDGIRVYGSPWTPTYGAWAWMRPRGEAMAEKWAMIPEGVDVLITHGPVKGILDGVPDRRKDGTEFIRHEGCLALYHRVMAIRPLYHLCGHIHESAGTATESGIQFINAAICDGQYRPVNLPVVFNIDTLKKGT